MVSRPLRTLTQGMVSSRVRRDPPITAGRLYEVTSPMKDALVHIFLNIRPADRGIRSLCEPLPSTYSNCNLL